MNFKFKFLIFAGILAAMILASGCTGTGEGGAIYNGPINVGTPVPHDSPSQPLESESGIVIIAWGTLAGQSIISNPILEGKDGYEGQEMRVTFDSITETSSGNYKADFSLYDEQGTLLDTYQASEGAWLNDQFVDQYGKYPLKTPIYLQKIIPKE